MHVFDSRKRWHRMDWATYLELPEIVAAGRIEKLLKLCERAADKYHCQTALNYINMIEARVKLMTQALDARDWRDFQRIKNELLGDEYEACELYPAEDRLVDGANQYHLWAINGQFPFGFDERLVSEDQNDGVQQRPWNDDERPDDLTHVTGEQMARVAGLED